MHIIVRLYVRYEYKPKSLFSTGIIRSAKPFAPELGGLDGDCNMELPASAGLLLTVLMDTFNSPTSSVLLLVSSGTLKLLSCVPVVVVAEQVGTVSTS